MSIKPMRVLFVCMGNICRSPLAEVIVRHHAELRGIDKQFHFESAGTGNWHVGAAADMRSADTARQHGLDLSHHHAQQITAADIHEWDWFIAMDQDNAYNLLSMGTSPDRTLMIRRFEDENREAQDVPDPYYGVGNGFERVYQMLKKNADPLLDYLIP